MDLKRRAYSRAFLFPIGLMILLSGCVIQSDRPQVDSVSRSTAVVDNTKDWPETTKRVVVTSTTTMYLMERLKVDLVGIPSSEVDEIPAYYKDATAIGVAMNPDIEIIRLLEPTYVFSPVSLLADLKSKYD